MLGEEGIQLTLLGWEGVVGGRLPGGDAIGASTTRWRKEEVHSRMTVCKSAKLRGLGWGIHVNPWLIHVSVWQKPLQYCKVISLQLIKINKKKKTREPIVARGQQAVRVAT